MSNIPMTWAELRLPETRCCKSCGATKVLTDFYTHRTGRDGKCKLCRNAEKAVRVANAKPAVQRATDADARELFGVFRTWQGGEPRTDWRADMGLVCWPMEWQALA
jgi:hypothetical protein